MLLRRAVAQCSSFVALNKVLDHSCEKMKVRINCFGSRRVFIKGYFFSVSLDHIAFKFFNIYKKNEDFSEEERTAGLILQEKMLHLYQEIYKTKPLGLITNFFLSIIQIISGDDHLTNDPVFNECYTKELFTSENNSLQLHDSRNPNIKMDSL